MDLKILRILQILLKYYKPKIKFKNFMDFINFMDFLVFMDFIKFIKIFQTKNKNKIFYKIIFILNKLKTLNSKI